MKCVVKTWRVFLISLFYSPFFFKLKKPLAIFFGAIWSLIGIGPVGNFKIKEKKTVWVGVSGGVDSSVSAILLKEQGYRVVGVFMKVYQPEVVTFCWRDEMLDAKKVCKDLDIPFIFLNLEKQYKKNIFDYMIDSYQRGETPNPDVFCNKFIKFGAFLEVALRHGADKVAMGHYARVDFNDTSKKFQLKKGLDTNKDQSYFLSAISQEQLSQSLFPIGQLQKSEVRMIAEEHNLFTANKKDSQGLCFVGKVNMREFLQNYLPKEEGKVLNINGEHVGTHEGAVFYTIGERHGFEIFPQFRTPNTPRTFVLEKNMEANTITVGEKNEDNIEKYLDETQIEISHINWISMKPDFSKTYTAMIRYRGSLIEARLKEISEERILVQFSKPQRSIARGQILVIYDGYVCVGEGTIL